MLNVTTERQVKQFKVLCNTFIIITLHYMPQKTFFKKLGIFCVKPSVGLMYNLWLVRDGIWLVDWLTDLL